jgi:hypothetical protein
MSDLNNSLVIRELIGSLFFIEWIALVDSMLIIESNSAHLLLHVSNVFKVILIDRHIVFSQLSNQLICDVLTSDIKFVNSVRHSVTLEYGDGVADTFTAFNDHTCGFTSRE